MIDAPTVAAESPLSGSEELSRSDREPHCVPTTALRRLFTSCCLLATVAFGSEDSSILGTWQTETAPPTFAGFRIDLAGKQRFTLEFGMYAGMPWRIAAQEEGTFVVELQDPKGLEESQRVLLEVRGGKKQNQLVRRDPTTGGTERLDRVSTSKTADPPFLGTWRQEIAGMEVLYEYTEDGWYWVRGSASRLTGKYRVEGNQLLFSEVSGPMAFKQLEIQGDKLVAQIEGGEPLEFYRPVIAVSKAPVGAVQEEPEIPVGVQGDFLVRNEFLALPGLGKVTDIVLGELDPAPGFELGLASDKGAILVNTADGNLQTVRFEEPAARVAIIDVEGDGSCEFMDRSSGWSPFLLFDHEGHVVWKLEPDLASDMATGDLDGDGKLEFVVAAGEAGSGLQRLDHTGSVEWKQEPDPVDDVYLLDQNADGILDIVYFLSSRGEIRWRDANGKLLASAELPTGSQHLGVYGPHAPGQGMQLMVVGSDDKTLDFLSYQGVSNRRLALPTAESLQIYELEATPVRLSPDGPTFTAVAVWYRKPYSYDRGGMLIFDDSGELRYQEILEDGLFSVAVIPAPGGQHHRLLVGGRDHVWEYELRPEPNPEGG